MFPFLFIPSLNVFKRYPNAIFLPRIAIPVIIYYFCVTKTWNMNKQIEQKWDILSSHYIFRRPWLTVRCDSLRLPTGAIEPEHYILEYPDWVNVIAITEDGQFVMVRQYRHGLQSTETELCAGVAEQGETPLDAAKRELIEETGYTSENWEEFMTISANPATHNDLTHCFIAHEAKLTTSPKLDETEFLETLLLSRDELLELMRTDKIKQSLMASPLWKFFAIY